MISAIRYEVEIHPPSSMPAPIAPWMSTSEALTIWMLSTAMKAPSVAPNTASQVFELTAAAAGAGLLWDCCVLRAADPASIVVWSAVMEVSSRGQRQDALGGLVR